MQKLADQSVIAAQTRSRLLQKRRLAAEPAGPFHNATQHTASDPAVTGLHDIAQLSRSTGTAAAYGSAAHPRRRRDPQRVVLADDNQMFRQELLVQIRQAIGNVDIHEVQTVRELVDICSGDAAANDMFLVDMAMPGLGGSEGLSSLHRMRPEAMIVAIGCPPDAIAVHAIFDAGISACILRSMNRQAFAAALALVMNGERYFPASLMLASQERGSGRDTGPQQAGGGSAPLFADGLTPRQREVLLHLSGGKSNKEIARALHIQEITVKVHLRAIFVCLNVTNRTQAAMHAERAGWFPKSASEAPLVAIADSNANRTLTIKH
jgi:DNA-binding NarL/FixJ family response regulator